jgi:hypothetical protein
MVRQLTGTGSYRDITKHLRVIRGEAGEGHEAEPPDPEPEDEPEAPAPDPDGRDVVAEAEAALQHAQQRVTMAEAQLPTLEAQVVATRGQVLIGTSAVLAASEARRRGLLPADDPALPLAEGQLQAAGTAHRQAQRDLTQAQRTVAEARQQVYAAAQGLQQARRDAYVQAKHPALWQRRLAAIEARDTDPALVGAASWAEPGQRMRAKALHQERLCGIEQEIDSVLADAGV